jgi:PTH1 family peptidyl-tRNA hydrolase
VGLGNPGKRYAATRHNLGRRVVEVLEEEKPDGVSLLKPDVFMNSSGGPAAEMARQKGISTAELLVVCDDFSIPLGTLRIRLKGSSGGHNGLDSVLQAFGTQDVPRLRMGVGPVPVEEDPADFVLKSFRSGERTAVQEMISRAVEAVRMMVREGVEPAMNQFNKKAVLE